MKKEHKDNAYQRLTKAAIDAKKAFIDLGEVLQMIVNHLKKEEEK